MKKRLTPNQREEIARLVKAGVSIDNVSKTLKVSKSTVYDHAKSYCRKMTRLNIALLNEFEKGYIIGLFLGDGSFNRGHKEPRFFVRFALDSQRDRDVALRIVQIIEKAGKRVRLILWKNNIIVKTCSKELVEYIQSLIAYPQGEKTLLANECWPTDFEYGFIAGIIDSDGHVHKHLGTEMKTVSLKNFESVCSVLDKLGISFITKVRAAPTSSYSKKPRYIIYIPSSEMKRNKEHIPSAKVARYLNT